MLYKAKRAPRKSSFCSIFIDFVLKFPTTFIMDLTSLVPLSEHTKSCEPNRYQLARGEKSRRWIEFGEMNKKIRRPLMLVNTRG